MREPAADGKPLRPEFPARSFIREFPAKHLHPQPDGTLAAA